MSRQERLDRWMEALYGARLRFHATHDNDPDHGEYWAAVYHRWRELYHAGQP